MIEIQNLNPKFKRINKKFLIEVAELVLKKEKVKKSLELSIAIVDRESMKKLNNQYRKKNQSTDVLSFGSIEGFYSEKEFSFPEIIICLEEVESNAEESGIAFKKELAKVLIHGILHLQGFDHEKGIEKEKRMFEKQDKYLSLFFK